MTTLRRRWNAVTVGILTAALAVGTTALLQPDQAATAAPTPDDSFSAPGARFTLAVLPDTQFYSRYATESTGDQFDATYGSTPFKAQTQWIADNANTYNTQMTLHLGDVVDQVGKDDQWAIASDAMKVLEDAGQPYSILAGNHDVPNENASPMDYSKFTETFSAERAAKNTTYLASDPTGAHTAHMFTVNGQQFLVLALSWGPSDADLAWANEVLDAHPGVPTILTSHQLINVSPDGTTAIPTDQGDRIWDAVIQNHDQVFLTLNGHHHGAVEGTRMNAAGHPVYQILMDYQMAYMGGNGYMGLLEFDLTNNKINQTSFSPWVMEKPEDTLVADDRALLDGPGQSFSLDFNFKERFPNLKVGEPTNPSYTKQLRDYIAENYTEPEQPAEVLPADANDYPKVDGTVAHWVMPTDEDGQSVPVGGTIEDISGNGNTLTRADLMAGASVDDVKFMADHDPRSANAGSVCFDNSSKDPLRLNYFMTAADAAANTEDFSNGFTFESFMKISPDFTPANNQWMAWLSRDGRAGNVPGFDDGPEAGNDPDEPPFAWAVSNLTELQFAQQDAQDPAQFVSSWSGEIVNLDRWMHIAVVNDPTTKKTTMYVDGVPVLRNAPNTLGVSHDGSLPWVLGAGAYGGVRTNGFLGCVGEVRLVDHALPQNQWLTAHEGAPAATETPEPSQSETPEPSQSETPEPSQSETPEPSQSETPEPSQSETPEPSQSEEPVQVAPKMAFVKSELTAAESVSGVEFEVAGLEPNAPAQLSVVGPEGSTPLTVAVTTNEQGVYADKLLYQKVDADTGEVLQESIPWPVGTYTVTVTQGDVKVTGEFTVTADADTQPTQSDVPGNTDQGSKDGRDVADKVTTTKSGASLASTGATDLPLFIGAAFVLLLAGGVLVLRRRAA